MHIYRYTAAVLINLLFALFLMQCVALLHPGAVAMPPPIQVPVELSSYYTNLTLEPTDVLSFGYQIASGMVSKTCSHPILNLPFISLLHLCRRSWLIWMLYTETCPAGTSL